MKCDLPPADEAQLEKDKQLFGTSYKYLCDCGRWHRLKPESVVIEKRSTGSTYGMTAEEILRVTGARSLLQRLPTKVDPSVPECEVRAVQNEVVAWKIVNFDAGEEIKKSGTPVAEGDDGKAYSIGVRVHEDRCAVCGKKECWHIPLPPRICDGCGEEIPKDCKSCSNSCGGA